MKIQPWGSLGVAMGKLGQEVGHMLLWNSPKRAMLGPSWTHIGVQVGAMLKQFRLILELMVSFSVCGEAKLMQVAIEIDF